MRAKPRPPGIQEGGHPLPRNNAGGGSGEPSALGIMQGNTGNGSLDEGGSHPPGNSGGCGGDEDILKTRGRSRFFHLGGAGGRDTK